MQLHQFNDASLLVTALAAQIRQILLSAIEERGQAYLVVSGGKTPRELFKALSQTELPWEKVSITLADERCVAFDHQDRNEALVCDFLLQGQAMNAQFISLYAENRSFTELEQLFAALPVFDIVILGMGEDGHTASLFPCAAGLLEGLKDEAKALVKIHPKTAAHERISLSKPRLQKSRHLFIQIQGEKKLQLIQQASLENNPVKMPVSAFLNNAQVFYAP